MVTVFHLVDAARATSLEISALRLLTDSQAGDFDHQIILLGGNLSASRFEQAGLAVHGIIPAPSAVPEISWATLRRVLARARREALVHAWSSRCAAAVVLARWRGPLLTTLEPPTQPGQLLLRSLQATLLRRGGRMLCGSTLERDAWSTLGAPLGSLVSLARPVSALPRDESQRALLRRRWRVGHDTSVIAPLESPNGSINAFRTAYLCGMLSVGGAKVRPLVSRGATQLERAQRFTKRHRGLWSLEVEDAEVTEVLEAIDVGVWLGSAPRCAADVRRLEVAAAHGIPIVALDTPVARDIARRAPSIRLESARQALPITRALFETIESRDLDEPPALAPAMLERHDSSRWLAQLHREHRRAMGMPIQTPAVAARAIA